MKKTTSKRRQPTKYRYGKKYEEQVLKGLEDLGIPFVFEGLKIKYSYHAIYKPDIVLANGIIVEVKTYLPYDEQRKLRAVLDSNPGMDIRIIFKDSNKILPNSKMTHGQWATKYGFIWADMSMPASWAD